MATDVAQEQTLEGELLCSLSLVPVSLNALARDMGVSVPDLRLAVQVLRSQGHKIAMGKYLGKKIQVWVEPPHWRAVQREGEIYWARTHGGKP